MTDRNPALAVSRRAWGAALTGGSVAFALATMTRDAAAAVTPASVDNLVALRAVTGMAQGKSIAFVAGHTTIGDGGGGMFLWMPAITTADDNGTCIKANVLETGRWVRVNEGAASVRWYGAKGDGITDDTAAIQATIESGLDVVFPAGKYRYQVLTFHIANQTITCASGAILSPLVASSRILVTGGASQVFRGLRVEAQDAQQAYITLSYPLVEIEAPLCVFHDVSLLCTNAAKRGVVLRSLTKCRFFGGEIKGWSGSPKVPGSVGVDIGDALYAAANEIGFQGTTIHHFETGVLLSARASMDDPSFFECSIENNTEYGIRVDTLSTSWGVVYNLKCFGCHFEGTKINISLAAFTAVHGGLVEGCRFGNSTQRIFRIEQGSGGFVGFITSSNTYLGPASYATDDVYVWEVEAGTYTTIDSFNDWYQISFSTGSKTHFLTRVASPNATSSFEEGIRLDTKRLEVGLETDAVITAPSLALDATSMGFFGAVPAIQPAGFVVNGSPVPSQPLEAAPGSATADNVAAVLADLIAKLTSVGLLGGS